MYGNGVSPEYDEEDFLQLSGIQHFVFCRRQWSLIHIEHQWRDNLRTVEGNIVHEKCHDEDFIEKRGDLLVCRGMRIFSRSLGLSGQCDVVEFSQGDDGATLYGREGLWRPCPIEYKRGKPKPDDADILQLCAQAICLEEMFCCEIAEGYLYYDEIHRRERVEISEYRQRVIDVVTEMRHYFACGYTPKAKSGRKCGQCSLKDICLPKMSKIKSVANYYQTMLGEE